MHRGKAGTDIFQRVREREKFLEYVGLPVARYEIRIHTYCLMTNHYHFLIETPYANLSQAIKWINVGYVAYFNRGCYRCLVPIERKPGKDIGISLSDLAQRQKGKSCTRFGDLSQRGNDGRKRCRFGPLLRHIRSGYYRQTWLYCGKNYKGSQIEKASQENQGFNSK